MDPIAFPPQIREFFQRHPHELADNDEIELINIFKENVSAKDDFIAWTREHQGVVERTPRLYKALELAIENPDGFGEVLEPWSGMVKVGNSINSLYHWVKDDGSYALINDLLKTEQKEENRVTHIGQYFPEKYVLTALELHEAGVINKNALKYLLSIKDPYGFASVFYAKGLKLAIPLIEKLESKDLVTIFSIRDKHDSIPLDYKGVLELAIPLFEKLEPKDLATILSIQNESGTPLLIDGDIFKLAIPLFETLDTKDLISILSIQNEYGTPLLFDGDIFTLAIPLLEKLDTKDLLTILSIQHENGTPLLLNERIFKLATPLLEKLDAKDLVTLLSIQNRNGNTILRFEPIFKLAIPLLEKLDAKDLITILSIQTENGYAPLHAIGIFELAIPLLEKLDAKDLITILSIQTKNGCTPLHFNRTFASTFELAIPLLEKLELSDRVAFLSIQDSKGQTFLHMPHLYDEISPILTGLPADSLSQLFSMQDNEGNTPLHNPLIFNKMSSLLGKIKPEVFQIRNKDGYTADEWRKNQVSMKWLVKDKIATDLKALSEEEYKEKVQQLKQNLDTLWDSFVFGGEEGNVPEEYLRLNIPDAKADYKPQEIKAALDVMVDKMIDRTPWLGTPRNEDKEGLHLFYTQMLNNFEQIVSLFEKEEGPEKKAGPLIGIAKVELEGRCAAAYQSEIEQAKMLLDSDSEGLGLEGNFDKLARASLTGSIENIVRREYGGDSHAFTQMLYSVGMAISPDPLSPITIESSQKEIIAEWTKEKLISGLTETIGRIDRDQLQAWFSSSTPDDFGQDFRLKQAEAEQAEKEIMMAAKEGLKQKGLENSLVESALTIFESTQGIALNVSSPQRKLVSVGVFDKLNQAATLDEVEEAKVLFSKESESDRLRKFAIMDEEDLLKAKPEETRSDEEKKMLDGLFQERRALQLKSLGVGNEFNALRLNAERRIKLDGLLKVQNPGMTRRELDIIVAEKKIFTDKIRAFADDKDIDFNPETGLPSKGVEFQRRAAYASQFFTVTDESIKLNRAGTFVILQHRGVLEKNEGLDVD